MISLAVGFALTASTVAVLNAQHLRSLPYDHADRLYHVMYAPPGPGTGRMEVLDWTTVRDVVEFPITASGATFYLTEGGAQSIRGLRAGPGMIQGLGVLAVTGRMLEPSDFTGDPSPLPHRPRAVARQCGSDPSIIGRRIRVEPRRRPGGVFSDRRGPSHRSSISAGIVRLGWTC